MENGASAAAEIEVEEEEEDDTVCLDESFFINDEYATLPLKYVCSFFSFYFLIVRDSKL